MTTKTVTTYGNNYAECYLTPMGVDGWYVGWRNLLNGRQYDRYQGVDEAAALAAFEKAKRKVDTKDCDY